MKKLITIIIWFVLLCAACFAYSGYVPTNITVQLINSSAVIINNPNLGVIEIINNSNTTYSWNVPYEYNLSTNNVTIITYNMSYNPCDYDGEFAEINNKMNTINCSQSVSRGETYYALYMDCFRNLTQCDSYKTNNEDSKVKLDACATEKDAQFQKMTLAETSQNACQTEKTTLILERDNLKGQRWLLPVITGGIGLLAGWFFFKGLPAMSRTGKFTTSKEMSPMMETIHPDQVKSYPINNLKNIMHPKQNEEVSVNLTQIRGK